MSEILIPNNLLTKIVIINIREWQHIAANQTSTSEMQKNWIT